MDVEQAAALLRLARFFWRRVADFRHGDAELLSHDMHGFGEGDVLNLLDESEDIASSVAAEAVKELVAGVDGERRRLFLVERAESQVILGAAFAQLDVVAHDPDDIGLLLDNGGKIAGVRHWNSVPQIG